MKEARVKTKGKHLKEIYALLSGLKVSDNDAAHIGTDLELPSETSQWTNDEIHDFAERVRKISKPIVIAANKMDAASDRAAAMDALQKRGYPVFATSAEMALAKAKAVKNGFAEIKDGKLRSLKNEPAVQAALDKIHAFGDDGVQALLDHVVFDVLKQIAAYPVEDEALHQQFRQKSCRTPFAHARQHRSLAENPLRLICRFPLRNRRQDEDAPGQKRP